MNADAATRARRLEVALRLVAAGAEAVERGDVPLSPADVEAARAVTPDELGLVTACLEIEAELREQAVAALERLLALLPSGGDLAERLATLPQPAFVEAVSALYGVGWAYGTPDESA
jgi:hypothetical protein